MQKRGRGHGWRWRGSSRQTVRFLEPALLLLLHHGPAQGPPRRVYRLSALGNKMLSSWTHGLQETRGVIDHILRSYAQHMEEGKGDYH
jgi:DNA-binding PadR family transcriptional regulator